MSPFAKCAQTVARQPKWWLLTEAALCLLVVGIIDCRTPWQFSLFVFYAGPIFLIALRLGQRIGVGFAVFATAVSWVANLGTQPFHDLSGYGWSIANRFTAFLFVGICGASISRFREETRKRLETLERARELEREIIRARDREQLRIGQDLHDSVCQSLAALDCATECLKVELENDGLPQAETAQRIQKLLKETTIEARNLARGLVPVALEPDGFVTALRGLATTTGALRHTDVGFESHGVIEIQDSDAATHLYRIAQEALSNAMRHANAAHVKVSVIGDGRAVSIVVADDGRGSAIQPQPQSDGLGWRTMRYRAKLIGASIKMEAVPGGGTRVHCTLPMACRRPAEGLVNAADPHVARANTHEEAV